MIEATRLDDWQDVKLIVDFDSFSDVARWQKFAGKPSRGMNGFGFCVW
jgi:hypothetical protein